jgi:hypothetical protein
VENELEWRYEVPKLLAAYEALALGAQTARVSSVKSGF